MSLARLPIRWRLTLGFALAFAVVVVASGLVLRYTLASSLDEGVEESLGARADEVVALVETAGASAVSADGAIRLSESEESFAQVIDRSGEVSGTTSAELAEPLLSPRQLDRAAARPSLFTIPRRPGIEHRARLLARATTGGEVVIVGSSLEDRDETVSRVTAALLLGGPLVVLLVSGLGYLLATLALRPVAAMRDRATEISGAPGDARLPLPEARDDIRRLGETLNAMLERIDAAMDRERSFVADASHELRTPLGILKAEIDLALSGDRRPDELRAALVSAGEETDQLVRLAEDLLVLSRAERGGLPIRAEDRPLRDELEAAVAPFRERAEAEGRSITVVAPGGARVVADPVRLRQAIGNLVDNALRHGRGAVTVQGASAPTGVTITVGDEGAGFAKAFAPHAFERFTRSDSARAGAGTGLGLAIVAAIASAHGGEAEIVRGAEAAVALRLPQSAGT